MVTRRGGAERSAALHAVVQGERKQRCNGLEEFGHDDIKKSGGSHGGRRLEVEGVDLSAQLRRDALALDRLQAGAVHVPDSGLPYVS